MCRVPKIMIIAILAGIIAVSCGDDNSVNGDNNVDETDMSWLSGDWTGTLTISKAGDCTISGHDSIVSNIIIYLAVTKGGTVTANEEIFSSQLSGYVLENLSYQFVKAVTWEKGVNMSPISCPDSIVTVSAVYSGTIAEGADSVYTIDMSATENWCPTSNCSFRLHYLLSRKCNP